MDPIRDALGPVRVNSWLRVPELNRKIPGSSRNSYHQFGCAVDFVLAELPLREAFDWICRSNIDYDKVILEYGSWIHIQSTLTEGAKPRLMALSKEAGEGYELLHIGRAA